MYDACNSEPLVADGETRSSSQDRTSMSLIITKKEETGKLSAVLLTLHLNSVHGQDTFTNTLNMGVEGFSHAHHFDDMNPRTGGTGELLFLLGFFGLLIPVLAFGRKANEDGIHREIKTTNRYAKMNLDPASSQPSKWTL